MNTKICKCPISQSINLLGISKFVVFINCLIIFKNIYFNSNIIIYDVVFSIQTSFGNHILLLSKHTPLPNIISLIILFLFRIEHKG